MRSVRTIFATCIVALALGMSGCAAPRNPAQAGGEQTDFLRRFHSSSQDRVARQYMPARKPVSPPASPESPAP